MCPAGVQCLDRLTVRQRLLLLHYAVRHELRNAFKEILFLEAGACALNEQDGYRYRIKKVSVCSMEQLLLFLSETFESRDIIHNRPHKC
jgi:hypothetical protein